MCSRDPPLNKKRGLTNQESSFLKAHRKHPRYPSLDLPLGFNPSICQHLPGSAPFCLGIFADSSFPALRLDGRKRRPSEDSSLVILDERHPPLPLVEKTSNARPGESMGVAFGRFWVWNATGSSPSFFVFFFGGGEEPSFCWAFKGHLNAPKG